MLSELQLEAEKQVADGKRRSCVNAAFFFFQFRTDLSVMAELFLIDRYVS